MGGKHAVNPILCADQPLPQNRLSRKAIGKLNVFDDDYSARESPFLVNDVHSRYGSSLLFLRYWVYSNTIEFVLAPPFLEFVELLKSNTANAPVKAGVVRKSADSFLFELHKLE